MSDELQVSELDCAICLQKCHHPTRLPCGHIFCFLCVKGVAIQNRKCAMCRAEIPVDYLDHPVLLEKLSSEINAENAESEYQWYYEGRNGWWKYDERSNIELETAFNNSGGECTLLLAGALYSIDFENMTQVKCNDQTRRRRVRRDTPMFPAKGIAGIKTEINNTHTLKREDGDSNTNNQCSETEDVIEVASADEDSDPDIQIVEVEPVVVEIDDVSEEFDRLSVTNSQNAEPSIGDV